MASVIPNPDFVCAPPGDPSRLFICEQTRQLGGSFADILILNLRTGALNPAPFLTVTVVGGGEEGLLGMAFDPGYAENGFFYVHYSNPIPHGSRIARYHVSPD